ncbi:PREDICTED: sulfate anion transporter 1 [Myotis davidii]|uniref:sulfate anion transporter 1 n=1 Tax=Myotis davidii TaxID=225400 RepID=UPI0003EC0F26|nr:PREDICTED: sulfate anion transporter 1 [Myotis davidii]
MPGQTTARRGHQAEGQAELWTILWYRLREDLAGDVMSGLVIGIILVPQAIAYSLLAGLQPVYSLYTSFFANLIYFLMGTSRHVSVGIFSLLCLMVGQVVDRELLLAGFDPAQDSAGPGDNGSALNAAPGLRDCGRDCYAIRVATALTLMAGIYQVLLGVLRLGFLSAYLSQPLLDGFATGASVTILTSQLRHLLGVRVPRHQGLAEAAPPIPSPSGAHAEALTAPPSPPITRTDSSRARSPNTHPSVPDTWALV